MTTKLLTLVQEVYFDLCDIIEGQSYKDIGFDDEREFLLVQKDKMARIERLLDFDEDCPKFEPAKEEI